MSRHVTLPIEDVISRARGTSQPRHGDRSPRLWWNCPFHDDANPSLCVEPGSARFHCFGCGASGDAIDFVRRLDPSLSFKHAVVAAGGELALSRDYRPTSRPDPSRRLDPTAGRRSLGASSNGPSLFSGRPGDRGLAST